MPLAAILDRIERVAAAGALPIVVLDLDSTLFDTAERHLAILREFADGHADAELRALVASLRAAHMVYEVDAPLRAGGYADTAVLHDLTDFWLERFFTDDYCLLDEPAPGAVAFTRRVVELGGLAYYLTGRPADAMAAGTFRALRRRGFPILQGRTLLHMKPSEHLGDRHFKLLAIDEIASLHGTVVATFENEPAHAALFLERFPDAAHFLYGTVRSPMAPEPHPDLVAIGSFHV